MSEPTPDIARWKIFVVIPTYNEARNIADLIPQVLAHPFDIEVLVVDDASPDGTGELVDAMRQKDARIHLLRRPAKQGLGTAYISGFRYALEHGAELVFEMDADFSHDPKYLPKFVRAAATADVVVGSRYLTGISVVNWPFRRLILSVFASQYARLITGLPMTDSTSGFKCFRRRVLETLNLAAVHSSGYSFQIEMNFRAAGKGFRLAEIPIIFIDRYVGDSKIDRRIVWEAAWMVWRLRFGLYRD
ncbi:MAG: polyprenol monophosphomannose synthase [Candidatus Wallbacteria bacterium]|nr:polyprenol monophosphomannose synthase [Candidatus Wallbacteria bacterium]